VHLSVPNDVLDAVVDVPVPSTGELLRMEGPPGEGTVDGFYENSKRPLIITGPAGMKHVRALEEGTGIPVIGMESPRGVKDPSLGRLAEVLAKADAVVLLGKRRDFTLRFGRAFAPDCRVLELEYGVALSLNKSLPKSGWLEEVHAALRYRPPEWATLRSKPEGPVHPVELCRHVQKLLNEKDAVLVSDGGEFGQWAQACLSAPHRVINGPAGAIGSALPFAAAAKLAFPNAPVVAMLGDGTFGFHMSEIDTAVRHKLPYVAVIGNDATWNAEYQIQLRAYGRERAIGCELLPTCYGAAAEALGGFGLDVSRPADVEEALSKAAHAGRVACVNVIIERIAAPSY
jgi:acetolactate synthase-1/2/3 large subunit